MIKWTLKNAYAKTKPQTLNFCTKEGGYSLEELRAKTVKNLRQLAKDNKIGLSGAKKKDDIVDIIFDYYSQIKSSESAITLPETFDIVTDVNDNINVSIWFQGNTKALDRCMNLKRFQSLLDQHAEINQKQPHEILTYRYKNNQLFLPPVLAIFVASYLSPHLQYQILEHFFYGKSDEAVYKSKISSLEQQLAIANLGTKLNRGLSWVDFEASFAYYWFIIDKTVKCGAVGVNTDPKNENRENLNRRLASHRSTHAKLTLLGVIKFKDSASVISFENWLKIVLSNYSIGGETLLEQYECSEGNSETVITEVILENFTNMGEGYGSLCSKELIDKYNEIAKSRLK